MNCDNVQVEMNQKYENPTKSPFIDIIDSIMGAEDKIK